ncbi:MAG: permease [Desulfofustis sp. PB-SRB1]|jgi:uncharacterized membrane protein YraQ (UPF0718 family)|nr:permease [Desulfofustis sp. PB-SRB1]MBM1003300.1 permease [Desulfofustis sp. PB-SRB1]HBH29583.1 permease [Desulfofustis sp.]HBH32144.1 permease [Desulfofustis sp.]
MEISSYIPMLRESGLFFVSAMVELSVLFVGISFLVGVLNEFLPQEKVKRWLSGRGGRGYFIGSLLGGLTPFCSCSTIPMMVGLLRAQAGFGPTMAFLFTSPLVNPVIIGLFFTLLGVEVTIIYAFIAVFLSIGISFMLHKLGFARFIDQQMIKGSGISPAPVQPLSSLSSASSAKPIPQPVHMAGLQTVGQCCSASATGSAAGSNVSIAPFPQYRPNRWKRILDDAVGQFKKLLPFVVLGVGIGSIIHGFLPADLVTKIAGADNPLAVPVSALVGIPLYLRVSTMVPIAASLMAKGMSMGAVVALIIGGAGASLPEVAMLKGFFKTPLLLAFLGSVMFMAVSAGFLINIVHG